MQVSVVISARDEKHNAAFTIHSIVNDLETFLAPGEFEIILVDNCSTDDQSWRFLAERGMYFHRTLRILHDPIAGNVTARNKGAAIAKGKYLFFSDAHMSYRVGSFKAMVEAIDRHGGMVHGAVQWMGGYDPSFPSWQYTIKLGEKVWGTWNRSCLSATEPFAIPASGHCCLGMLRQQFLDFGGYNNWFRCYGGGELYLDLKWWMLGSSVWSVPKAVGYHLSAGRGYSFHNDDLIHNMMLMCLALGADAWAERIYIRYMCKPGIDRAVLDRMYADAKKEATSDRESLPEKCRHTFNDLFVKRPWDLENEKVHGASSSLVSVFDGTWTEELPEEAKSFYRDSPLQKALGEFIEKELAHLVYKGKA